MRLIDADALLEQWSEVYTDAETWHRCIEISTINSQPTIDAVEVVRCKECIYAENARVNEKGFTICEASNMEITENDFCSYGERKEGAEKNND